MKPLTILTAGCNALRAAALAALARSGAASLAPGQAVNSTRRLEEKLQQCLREQSLGNVEEDERLLLHAAPAGSWVCFQLRTETPLQLWDLSCLKQPRHLKRDEPLAALRHGPS